MIKWETIIKQRRTFIINRITLNNVASYKKPAILETDKKINLIYGLNGTGKVHYPIFYMIEQIQNIIWKIKKDYTSEDKILEFCLEGLKNSKETLFAFVEKFKKSNNKSKKTIENIKKEVQSISGDDGKKYKEVSIFNFTARDIEDDEIFMKQIVDDPISSLSHIYVFNIGRLIHNEFLRTDKYEQVIVLTHSLYFFMNW